MAIITVENNIKHLENLLARNKLVLSEFPDAEVYYDGFRSKLVNKNYNKFEFYKESYSVRVAPYCEIITSVNGKTEIIKIYSKPRSLRLVYKSWAPPVYRFINDKGTYIIKFSRLSINLKNNNFKDDMLNSCRIEILNFLKENPSLKIDQKYLEPRLKNLLAFT